MVATALSGSMTLRESTYTERIVFEVTLDGEPFPGGDRSVVVSGDYTIDGQILNFDPEPAGSAEFSGTLSEDGTVLSTTEVDPQFGQLDLLWVQ